MIRVGRSICSDSQAAAGREWLATNGIGGYASGTVSGELTRTYHGLLVAALDPPLGRTVLLSKLDEIADFGGERFALSSDRWGGPQAPGGKPATIYLESFHLEGTIPVWTYALADARLEKRIWMAAGENTTYVQYRLRRASGPLDLRIKALVTYRSHHGTTQADGGLHIEELEGGLRIQAYPGAVPFVLLSDRARAEVRHEWYRNYYLSVEDRRGQDALTDNLHAADFHAVLEPGGSLLIVASTQETPDLDGAAAYERRRAMEDGLIAQAGFAESALQQLTLAADQFIVRRAVGGDPEGRSVIAGYPWFSDWGRDTMIALPGLALATGRAEVAAQVLCTYARFVDQGMLPNRFPSGEELPEYNSVDASLWTFEAARATVASTGDDSLAGDLFPTLARIVTAYTQGTRYQIHADPADGLLYAGEEGVQLTWMDAKVGERVVTPRTGKPVEINALWINALRIMADFAGRIGEDAAPYVDLAGQAEDGFARFWNADTGCLFDVLDGPNGDDPALRPNQIIAAALPHTPLSADQRRAVVDVCARHLLTSLGLRSLSPDDAGYTGHYGGDQGTRDSAYHQGTAWPWLIGPFVQAHLRVYGDPEAARAFLDPLLDHLHDFGLGTIGEIADGDPPHTPRGCIAQAWSVGAVLQAWRLVEASE